MNHNELIDSFIEVTLPHEDNFLLIKETLTRIGISSKDMKLFQSCHILHKQNRYYIVHFKELFLLDGKTSTIDETDIARRNTIAKLLHEWKLCNIVGATKDSWPLKMNNFLTLNKLKIVPFSEKTNWELVSKYNIGKR